MARNANQAEITALRKERHALLGKAMRAASRQLTDWQFEQECRRQASVLRRRIVELGGEFK